MPRGHTVKIGEDWVDGMLVGRAARMADWTFKKEQKAFRKLCGMLYWRKWRKENSGRARAYVQAYKERHPERCRESQRRRKRKWEAAHPEKAKAGKQKYARNYYLRNRERLKAKARARRDRSRNDAKSTTGEG